jgi:HAD superfamily hydrolase (TIGR01544 family)
MEDVIINDQDKFAKIKKAIADGGSEIFFVLADFDRTLTPAYSGKSPVPSLISVLRSGGYLSSDYALKAQALFDHYRKIEIDRSVPLEDKKKSMKEWWTAHFKLLIEAGLKYRDLEKIAESGLIKLRLGCQEFLAYLRDKGIPLIIMSSSGAGREGISIFLKKNGMLTGNIEIISNEFEWTEDGRALRVKQPIIYGMNKDAATIKNFPAAAALVKGRKNVLLLGDSLSDAEMIRGFGCGNILKIGFLNERIRENLADYKECFDVVILSDGTMKYVNDFLKIIQ